MTGRVALLMAVMAVTTYLIRALPFVVFRKKITSRFARSFLAYAPYAVLSAMTIPAVFSSAASLVSSAIGFAVAALLALKKKSLLTVAAAACAAAFAAEWLANLI